MRARYGAKACKGESRVPVNSTRNDVENRYVTMDERSKSVIDQSSGS